MPNEKAVMKSILLALSLLAAVPAQGKDLIVYLSRSHNTEAVAKIIQSETGGDLVAIELQTPYPADYRATVEQVQRENERGYLPPLKTRIRPAQYDRIFIGFPTWGMRLPTISAAKPLSPSTPMRATASAAALTNCAVCAATAASLKAMPPKAAKSVTGFCL